MSDVVDDLVAHARAAKRAHETYEREIAKVRELLPVVRATDPKLYGPRKLEGMIGGVLERGTISRLTAPAIGTSRKKADEPA